MNTKKKLKNAVVCHGVPDDKPLKDGDILNIDVCFELNILELCDKLSMKCA